jgi:NIMA (never in mitosis gene a)-related kinase
VRPASLARSLFSSGAKVVFFTLLTAGFLLSDSIRTSLKRNRTVAMKHKQFVKLFEVSQEEEILYAYHCSQKEKGKLLIEGHVYLTQNFLCFYAHFFGRERKITIKWEDVTGLERRTTAKIIPNAILVRLKGDKEILFRNFLNRHEAFTVMDRLWNKKQLVVKSTEIAQLTQQKNWKQQLKRAMKEKADRYKVVGKLGEGGFGLVFIVLDKRDFRQYVLKEVCCVNEEEAKDAMREMVLLRLLRHPYIVKYKDFWQEELHVFIVMEYCQGGDVSAIIDDGIPVPEKRVVTWLIQILLALAHIHSHNVLHRDIKPGNLFLNKWKDIKIGDFGLSTVRKNKKKQHQTPVGTMGYAAPELLKGKAYNEKSDMYALGCCLYEILTMRSVYDDDNEGCFPVPIPPNYNHHLTEILHSLLHENDTKRPSAKDLLDHPFLQEEARNVRTQSEIYAELQQREDEADELRLKLNVLQQEVRRLQPEARVIATSETNMPVRRHSLLLEPISEEEISSDSDSRSRSSSSSSSSSSENGKGKEEVGDRSPVTSSEDVRVDEDEVDDDDNEAEERYMAWKRMKEQQARGWQTERPISSAHVGSSLAAQRRNSVVG